MAIAMVKKSFGQQRRSMMVEVVDEGLAGQGGLIDDHRIFGAMSISIPIGGRDFWHNNCDYRAPLDFLVLIPARFSRGDGWNGVDEKGEWQPVSFPSRGGQSGGSKGRERRERERGVGVV